MIFTPYILILIFAAVAVWYAHGRDWPWAAIAICTFAMLLIGAQVLGYALMVGTITGGQADW